MADMRFMTPLDVIFPRGNKLFGEAGQHGEAQMPPWPSVFAGAVRSRMLVDAGIDLAAFANGTRPEGPLGQAVGTPEDPGHFRITWCSLASRQGATVSPIVALPADLAARGDTGEPEYLKPLDTPPGLKSSATNPKLAVLQQTRAGKPKSGVWLTGPGLAAYIRGDPLRRESHAMQTARLWKSDPRLGIALDPTTRTAEEGRIYTTEGVALEKDIGFLVGIAGAGNLVPADGLVRLGGDGRGAALETCSTSLPEPDWKRIEREGRFRLVLATPGMFAHGWRVPGLREDGITWHGPHGCSATLLSAAVSRAQVISGWDLAKRTPKAAVRTVPTGSVYWFEAPDEKPSNLVDALRTLATEGFGCLETYPDRARLAEGFNRVMVANWATQPA